MSIFALATGGIDNDDVSRIGALAAEAMVEAIRARRPRGDRHSRVSGSKGHGALTRTKNEERNTTFRNRQATTN